MRARVWEPWALAGCVALVALKPVAQMWETRWSAPDSPDGYQPMVALLSAVTVWLWQPELGAIYASLSPDRRRGGWWLAALGCGLILVWHLSRMTTVGMLGLVAVCAGVILRAYGPQILRALAVPLLFLCLLVPLPRTLVEGGTAAMQRGSTNTAADLLAATGHTATAEGNNLTVGSYRVQVVRACSGMGIVMPTIVLGLWLVLAFHATWERVIIVLAGSFLIGAISNVLRITVIGAVGAQRPALGDALHDANSWFFTIVALVLLAVLARLVGVGKLRVPCVE